MLKTLVCETKFLVFEFNVAWDIFLWVDCFHDIFGPANSWEWNVEGNAPMMNNINSGLVF